VYTCISIKKECIAITSETMSEEQLTPGHGLAFCIDEFICAVRKSEYVDFIWSINCRCSHDEITGKYV